MLFASKKLSRKGSEIVRGRFQDLLLNRSENIPKQPRTVFFEEGGFAEPVRGTVADKTRSTICHICLVLVVNWFRALSIAPKSARKNG